MRRVDGWWLAACLLVAPAAAQAPFDGARVLAGLTPEQRASLQRRAADWDALPESMRRERREAWEAWRALPVDERARMRAAHSAFRTLPIDRQQALRARFEAQDAGLRRGWLLGPALGADWPWLHALFAQVPAARHAALLEALRTLPPQARADLALLAQRTPPQDREALREQLLATPAAQRADWLRRRAAP